MGVEFIADICLLFGFYVFRWGPLIGPKKAFDPTKFFIVCCNVLGSPYGSASPLTINPDTNNIYGPEFPLVSVRDDVKIHRLILDQLGVKQIAICVGGSMGGMQVLEWAQMGKDYVRSIVPIATSGRHSAWGISWGEAQRQSIYSDPNYGKKKEKVLCAIFIYFCVYYHYYSGWLLYRGKPSCCRTFCCTHVCFIDLPFSQLV
jgi:hypothetical protein